MKTNQILKRSMGGFEVVQRTVAGESAYEVDKERIVYNTMLE